MSEYKSVDINQDIKNMAEIISQAVPAEKIYLFGSYAYGTPHKDSDYDFFIVVPDGVMRPLEVMQKARRALGNIGRTVAVDVLADYHSRFFDRSQLNTLEKKIAQEGVILYDRT